MYMQAAIEEARKSKATGGIPIGAVLAGNDNILGRGHNQRVQKNDPMAHAEIDCLQNAGRQKSYKATVLYSTLMPCYLCSGAIVQFKIPKIVVAEATTFQGAPEFLQQHGVEIEVLHDKRCIEMMEGFIQANPGLWHEDIGEDIAG